MPVRVVVDSAAGLPREIAEELDIAVIDMHVMDGEGDESTSGLTALELTACYARQLERGGDDGVVALHLARSLSSTWSAAVTASAVFPGTVRVVDSDTAGMAIGAAAMAAATVAREGGSLDECEAMARSTIERSETWLYLQQTEGLRKSGRLSTGTALSATLLATKPILRLRGGKFEVASKTRTQTKAFARLAELVQERAGGQPVFAAVQHADAPEAAEHIASTLDEVLPQGSQVLVEPLVEVLAVHTGPGAVGLSVVFSSAEPAGEL
ncbi:DegV family protein [Corynebacterium aquatimens]|uniref:DegV family protein n=1 Tax=Corynebacterium TaxID=1716 RepID=UPI001F357052|nr:MULTISPECIES: DegV family protein [Corynebacterium]QYH19358.1 DegV family protein [Corynebacterium aquatimens]UIZ91735.1 DegV family protein [Corynebacterium sp. CNCTC7651]